VLEAQVHEASIQDRDGASSLIASAKQSCPSLVNVFAEGGYAGEKLAAALSHIEDMVIEIVKRSDDIKSFVVLPKRWVV
jgi:hypothetical protein